MASPIPVIVHPWDGRYLAGLGARPVDPVSVTSDGAIASIADGSTGDLEIKIRGAKPRNGCQRGNRQALVCIHMSLSNAKLYIEDLDKKDRYLDKKRPTSVIGVPDGGSGSGVYIWLWKGWTETEETYRFQFANSSGGALQPVITPLLVEELDD